MCSSDLLLNLSGVRGPGGGGAPAKYHIGNNLSGTVNVDFRNGPVQTCSLNGDTQFTFSNGSLGDSVKIYADYESGHKVSFDAGMPPRASALQPFVLDIAWKSILIQSDYIGGSAVITDCSPYEPENTD